jgi:enamine deaminase RidA (YjgF/YER057c/UK114 family)
MKDQNRRVVTADGVPDAPGWSHAVAAGGWLFGGGMMATDFKTGLLADARPDPWAPWAAEALEPEARVILERVGLLFASAGYDLRSDLIRVWQWIVAGYPDDAAYAASRAHWPCFPSGTPYARKFGEMVGDSRRSSTGIGVRQLPIPGAMMSVDFIAVEPREGVSKQTFVLPADLPQPKIGYSPATRHGDWVFLAGYGATDFKGDWMSSVHMGERSLIAPEARVNPYIWLGSEIEAQTEYTLAAMARIAEAAGTSLARCVKADVTITHPADFAGMDRVWRRYFPDAVPARNVLTGAQLVVKGTRVEIAMLLLAGDSSLERTEIRLPDMPPVAGHAPHAVHAGDFLFTSSLLPIGMEGHVPAAIRDEPSAPRFRDPAAEQTRLIAGHLERLCAAAGAHLADVCKVQAFLDDLDHLPAMMTEWRRAFPEAPPALSAMAMGGGDPLLVPGACVQWDAIAYAPRHGAREGLA